MNKLLELADRCEAATGPDPQIDAEIVAAMNNAMLKPYPPATDFGPHDRWQFWSRDGAHFLGSEGKFKVLPVTASLDAAMTLVPEGWTAWGIWSRQAKTKFYAVISRLRDDFEDDELCEEEDVRSKRCPTPALALCAAALRARAASQNDVDALQPANSAAE